MRLEPKTAKTQFFAALMCLLTTASCAMNRPSELWTDEVLKAQKLADENPAAGASEYERLRESAPNQRAYRWVTHEWAELEEELGNQSRAIELYKENSNSEVIDQYGADGLYAQSRLATDTDAAFRTWFNIILKYPNELAAERALDDVYDSMATSAPNATQSTLEKLAQALGHTYLVDNVLFLKAKHCDTVLNDADCALDTFRRIYVEHNDEALADDALWEVANIYRRHGMWPQAIDALNVMADDTESSWFVGSYDSEWVDDAIFDLGMIHMLMLKDYDTAVSYFMRFADDYEFSLRADDALWTAAEARRLQGRDEQHFYQLRVLLKRYPESRYAETARARLGISGEDES